jgi:DNA-binding LytR/AlgR family response regulator
MSETYRCLIVDDEPAAHFVLVNYIERMGKLQLEGQCYNVLEAINFLHLHQVDIIFLDINMPELSGFDLLKTLAHPPRIILTTAYSEFALDSYEYGAMDYLLKPIQFPRFLKSIDRFIATQPQEQGFAQKSGISRDPSFMVKVDGSLVRIDPEELIYAQSLGNYVKLFTSKQTYLASITTTELEHRLPSDKFMRIHKSHIISLDKVTRFSNAAVSIGSTELPVGITFRRELTERLKEGLGARV